MFRGLRVLAIGLVLVPVGLRAQETAAARTAGVWVSGGLGGGSEGVALLAELAYQTGAHQLSIRGTLMADLYDDAVADLGVLYARAWQSRNWNLALGGGIGYMATEHCPECSGELREAVGVPLMARAVWHPIGALGLGLYGFGNVNTLRSFAGLALTVSIGKLR